LIAGDYDDELLAKLVKNLKYKFARDLSRDLGEFLAMFFARAAASEAAGRSRRHSRPNGVQVGRAFRNALVVPVPLHRRRERWRGFNQAELIARHFSDQLGFETSKGKLVRTKHTGPQTGLDKEDRKKNVKNCFVWQGDDLRGRNIILVDDVATTGSTLNECARALKKSGAGEVWGLVAANG